MLQKAPWKTVNVILRASLVRPVGPRVAKSRRGAHIELATLLSPVIATIKVTRARQRPLEAVQGHLSRNWRLVVLQHREVLCLMVRNRYVPDLSFS